MSTTKSQGTSNQSTSLNQAGKAKNDILIYRSKVTELERQINDYQIKLEELRRAKVTTVVKLEKEYINTNSAGSNRLDQTKSCEKCEELERMLESENKLSVHLKRMTEQKDNNKQQHQQSIATYNPNSCSTCSDLKQLLDIEKQNNIHIAKQCQSQKKQKEEEKYAQEVFKHSLEIIRSELIQTKNSFEVLKRKNQEYKNKFELIKKEHDKKMAHLYDQEEQTKKEIETWEQVYHEWMATMERRVNNLQVTDEELQKLLNNKNKIDQ